MSNEVLQAIADIYIKNNPSHADVYTVEWVRDECATFNRSPEEALASLQASEARRAARSVITDNQPLIKDHPNPAHYAMKYGGPIDALSYELMEKSGELAKMEVAFEAEQKQEAAKGAG
ncbi:MAG: hypothetical protein PHR16_11945 [Methylovulum sp.]|nr:hypothetical protein [Methylovulum sp.]